MNSFEKWLPLFDSLPEQPFEFRTLFTPDHDMVVRPQETGFEFPI